MVNLMDQWSRLAAINLIGRTIIERDRHVGLETHGRITKVKIGAGSHAHLDITATLLKEGVIGGEPEPVKKQRVLKLGGAKDLLAIGFKDDGEIVIGGPYIGPFTIKPNGKG